MVSDQSVKDQDQVWRQTTPHSMMLLKKILDSTMKSVSLISVSLVLGGIPKDWEEGKEKQESFHIIMIIEESLPEDKVQGIREIILGNSLKEVEEPVLEASGMIQTLMLTSSVEEVLQHILSTVLILTPTSFNNSPNNIPTILNSNIINNSNTMIVRVTETERGTEDRHNNIAADLK